MTTENNKTALTEEQNNSAAEFFRTHAKEIAEFFVAQGIDKKTLRDVLKEMKASNHVKQALDAVDVKENPTQVKDEKRTLDHMARLSRGRSRARRPRGL